MASTERLQLDTQTGYASEVLAPLLPMLDAVVTDPHERVLLHTLRRGDGNFWLASGP